MRPAVNRLHVRSGRGSKRERGGATCRARRRWLRGSRAPRRGCARRAARLPRGGAAAGPRWKRHARRE
eukprot:7162033-Prymnesium_polylepis.1